MIQASKVRAAAVNASFRFCIGGRGKGCGLLGTSGKGGTEKTNPNGGGTFGGGCLTFCTFAFRFPCRGKGQQVGNFKIKFGFDLFGGFHVIMD